MLMQRSGPRVFAERRGSEAVSPRGRRRQCLAKDFVAACVAPCLEPRAQGGVMEARISAARSAAFAAPAGTDGECADGHTFWHLH